MDSPRLTGTAPKKGDDEIYSINVDGTDITRLTGTR